MNLCILQGNIINEIEFKFILCSKNKSIAYFDMQLLNKSIIRIKTYNEMADYIYRKLKKDQNIIVCGRIRDDGTVEGKNFILPRKDSIFKNKEL